MRASGLPRPRDGPQARARSCGVALRAVPRPRPHPMTPVGRSRIRDVFVRVLGVIFVVAFWSLGRQVLVLYGERGLLPACPVAGQALVTIFRFHCSDALLWWGTLVGAAFGVTLALGVVPRWALLGCWLLYASYVNVGQDFLSFQWDNLLLESGFFALFVTPGGWRLRDGGAPHPLGGVPDAVAAVPALRRVGAGEAAPRRSDVARPDGDGDLLGDGAAPDLGRLVRAPAADVGAARRPAP